MQKLNKMLVIGNSARSIACSAKRAGYRVYAIDRFGDLDLNKCAEKAFYYGNCDENKLYELAALIGNFDGVVLGPGFEHLKFKNSFNNAPEIMERINDKSKLPELLRKMDIPHPMTEKLENDSLPGFPLMLKPIFGSGGMRNIVVRSEQELEIFRTQNDIHQFIAQEFIEGIPCSASIISTGEDACVLALNEQLIGIDWLTGLPFAYCGNITPFHTKLNEEMIQFATRIATEFKLVGSNGVDFMLTEKGITVLEVNPRFQGSLDTVELSTGMNIFDAHIKSFSGELPELKKTVCFAAKEIVYANKEIVIYKKIHDELNRYLELGQAADIPCLDSIIRTDEPVATILGKGETRNDALENVEKTARFISLWTRGGLMKKSSIGTINWFHYCSIEKDK